MKEKILCLHSWILHKTTALGTREGMHKNIAPGTDAGKGMLSKQPCFRHVWEHAQESIAPGTGKGTNESMLKSIAPGTDTNESMHKRALLQAQTLVRACAKSTAAGAFENTHTRIAGSWSTLYGTASGAQAHEESTTGGTLILGARGSMHERTVL
eukprot:1141639-Pelagomonas_calceolata.AAC.2